MQKSMFEKSLFSGTVIGSRRRFLKQATGASFAMALWPCWAAGDSAPACPPIGVCGSADQAARFKRLGAEYVEDSVQRYLAATGDRAKQDAMVEAARQAGLPVPVCNGFLPGELKAVGPAPNHDKILAYAEKAFARAKDVGVQLIVFGSGKSRFIPEEFDHAKAMDQLISLCRRLAPLATSNGLVVAFETLNRNETNCLNKFAQARAVVEAVNSPAIALTADLYHAAMEGDGPDELRKSARWIRHVHIAEKKGRTPPGVTGFDFTGWFKELQQAGYKGRISLECRWKDQAAEMPTAVKTIREQWAKAAQS